MDAAFEQWVQEARTAKIEHVAEAHMPGSAKEARAAGVDRYVTGKPCQNGHVSERRASDNKCLACDAERAARKRREYPEKARESNIRRYKKHRDKILAANALWRKENKERILQLRRAEYKENAEKIKQRNREIWAKNSRKYGEKSKEWRAKNPEIVRACIARRRARVKEVGGTFSSKDVTEIMTLQKGKCGCCRKNLEKVKWHVDHITPIAKGGTNDRRNIQILCVSCNKSKSASDPIEFMQSRGRLL